MFSIQPCSLPGDALLTTYQANGAYTDCYATDMDGSVSHAQFVTAFYTTALFKLERVMLKWAVSKPSTDAQAEQLASGATDAFAAWHVEKRCENQLLMCDFQKRTRSWLMVAPLKTDRGPGTRLFFGWRSFRVATPKPAASHLDPGFVRCWVFTRCTRWRCCPPPSLD